MVRVAAAAVSLIAAGSAFAASVPSINAGSLARRGLWDSVVDHFSSQDTRFDAGSEQLSTLYNATEGVWNATGNACQAKCSPWRVRVDGCNELAENELEGKYKDNSTLAYFDQYGCVCAASSKAMMEDCAGCLDVDDDKVGYLCDSFTELGYINTTMSEQTATQADSLAGGASTLKLASAAALAAVAGIAAIGL